MVLEARSPKSECRQGWFLLKAWGEDLFQSGARGRKKNSHIFLWVLWKQNNTEIALDVQEVYLGMPGKAEGEGEEAAGEPSDGDAGVTPGKGEREGGTSGSSATLRKSWPS